MKRFIALFLLLSLLCLWGCGKPAEQTAPTTEETQVTASSDVPQTTEETEAPVPSTTEEEAGLYAEYTNKLLTERNTNMADTAEDYLAQGGTGFFVVGAAHIIGEGACAELLAQRGYSVERIG